MNGQISWRTANKKRKMFLDRQAPEWLWITMFLLVIAGAVTIVINYPKFDPEMAYSAQIDRVEVKTAAVGQILPKTGVVGVASWYDYSLDGIEWSKDHDTCASRDHKRYSTIRVTNLDNGKSVDCYVNDYGPELGQTPERHIDLSSHAFGQIADLKLGLVEVKIDLIN
jgi:rare lipoprotein A (peptidoglycan hydrolase)